MFSFAPSETLDKVDRILESLRAPAIMLHRPYPPIDLPFRSRLGGLPLLPEAHQWPHGHGSDGRVPLHFLAQIDCSELPRVDARLPTTGMLFFFARDDEEQLWEGGEPRDSMRVIYAPNVPPDTPPQAPPPDLPPIRGRRAGDSMLQIERPPWPLPEEDGPKTHSSWPLVALRIDSWPDCSAIYETQAFRELVGEAGATSFGLPELRPFFALYEERVRALRVGAAIAATGLPTETTIGPHWGGRVGDLRLMLPADSRKDSVPFPKSGAMIDKIARMIAVDAINLIPHRSYQQDEQQRQLRRYEAEARQWIALAREIGHDAAPSDAEADEFRRWLSALADQDPTSGERRTPAAGAPFRFRLPEMLVKALSKVIVRAPNAQRTSTGTPPALFQYRLANIFTKALSRVVVHAAGSPRAAALIPPNFFDLFENEHLPVETKYVFENGRRFRRPSAKIHQMLGHAPSQQDARPIDDETVLLLQLMSDDALDMGFGDCGAAYFWIGADDLTERRFENAWSEIV